MTDVSVYDCSGYLKPKSRPSSGGVMIHAPASGNHDHLPSPVPLCKYMGVGGRVPKLVRWYDSGAIPDGYYDECPDCIDALADMPDGWIP